MNEQSSLRNKYLASINGRALLAKHELTDIGIWHVVGEDGETGIGPSTAVDFGLFRGSLSQVIDHVVDLPHFWGWGSGGNITMLKIEDLNSPQFVEKKRLRARIARDRAALENLEAQLQTMENQ